MRSIFRQRSRKGIARAIKLSILGLIMTTMGTGQALAQAKSCNPDLDFNIANPGPYFLGDPMRVSANLGARDIDAGNYMDIESFGFALNCHADEDFHSCTDAGNDVAFLTTPVTDCLNADGDPASLIIPQTNIIPIRVQGPPIRTPKNSQCNVQFDISVTGLDTDDDGNVINNRIVQAMGWPIEGGDPALCDNGLTSAATSTISYEVETCGIEVEKQVSIDQVTWFDADTAESAINVGTEDTAYYRLIVKNTSSVDYIGQMSVADPDLGFAGSVDGLEADEEVVLGGNNGFDVSALCANLGEGEFTFDNTATVAGVCRTGDHPLGEVLASGLDKAYINCKPYNIRSVPAVDIEKSTNGVDADTPDAGPTLLVGDPVTWDYVVYNRGKQPLTLDLIIDNKEGAIECEKSYLDIDEFTNCTAKTGVAGIGQYQNIARVEATAAGNGQQVNDTDPSHYFGQGRAPVIKVAKSAGPATMNQDGSVNVTYTVTVSNTGNESGTYDLVDTLMINSAFTPAAIVSNVAYLAGTENSPTGTLGAPTLADYSTGATLVTGESLAEGLNESFVFTLKFNVDMDTITPKGANCIADDDGGNTGLTNHVDVYVGGNIVDQDEACAGISLQPSISVLKEIWDGNGWVDANDVGSAPFKTAPAGAAYRITITNTGPVDLDNLTITDDLANLTNFGVNGGVLAAGQMVVLTEDQVEALNVSLVCGAAGSFKNTVTANALGVENAIPVSASEIAWLVCVDRPAIEVKKYISLDGVNFVDDTAGPVEGPSGAVYKITVENTGDVDLVGVTVDDNRILGGPYDVGDLAVDQVVTITSDEWAQLDVPQVCGGSGLIENKATAKGTSDDVAAEEVTDTDSAWLDCIGEPMISIIKKVSLNGGLDWHDADEAPYPTAVVDDTAETAEYQITVGNVGTVKLFDVVVNDSTLGILNYDVGDMEPGASVVLDSGDIAALSRSDICSSRGEKANVAYAKGFSAANEEDEASDSATVDCIGEPMIRVLKEASKDGVLFFPASVSALVPSDAYWRITVENIGNVDLENVRINDPELNIVDYYVEGAGGTGSLAMEEIVVISWSGDPDNDGINTLAELEWAGFCDVEKDLLNEVLAEGKAVDSTQTVNAVDDVTFSCEVPVDICEEYGRPRDLEMEYVGISRIDHHQQPPWYTDGPAASIVPHPVDLPPTATIEISDKQGTVYDTILATAGTASATFEIQGKWLTSGKILPNINIKIYDGGTLLQTIDFHGSCSAPIVVGDQYGGVVITDFTPFQNPN